MLGNVWEWTNSEYQPYSGSVHEITNYGDTFYVIRGGSWINESIQARCSCRGRYEPTKKRPYLGFRIIAELDTTQLRKKIADKFNLDEIKILCYDLDISPDEFIVETKEAFILKLIIYCEHRNLLEPLVDFLEKRRPLSPS